MTTPDDFTDGFDAATDHGAHGLWLAVIAWAVVASADERSVFSS